MSKWRSRGQGLVEFALVLPALLLIVLSIIEGALLFQSYLAIQHAAREAARYAVAYQPPMEYSAAQGKILLEGGSPGNPAFKGESESAWYGRRVSLVKQRAFDQAMGIRTVYPALDETSFVGLYAMPGFFGVRVWGFPAFDQAEQLDHPGLQGLPVRVRVYYRWEALDPIIGAIAPNGLMITGEAVMINEGIQTGYASVAPPTFAPPPPLPGPTSIPTDVATPTPTPSPEVTLTPTLTPTPTATPTGAYVLLTDDRDDPIIKEWDPWLLEELSFSTIRLSQHTDPGPYRVYWTDNCGTRTYLGLSLPTALGLAREPMPDPLPGGFEFLCGDLGDGVIYEAWLETCPEAADCSSAGNHTARNLVRIRAPVLQPDLIVSDIIVPTPVAVGVPVLVEVVISNVGADVVSGTFDIDIYADPAYTPVLKGQPGFIASGTGSAKQWYGLNIAPSASVSIMYALTLQEGGEHTLWAQVDTSFAIEEEDEENNISGPVEFMALCSDKSDGFDAGVLDGKWVQPLTEVGDGAGGSGSATITADGEVRLEGVGSSLWDGSDGKFFVLNQGDYDGNFDMSVKVTDYMRDQSGSLAGLMVRESLNPGARYAAVGVVNVGGAPHFQAIVRDTDGTVPVDPCGGTSAISPFGDGVWVRITREGDVFTLYTSTDGTSWNSATCMQTTLPSFAVSAVPGIVAAPWPELTTTNSGWRSPSADQADSGGDGDGFEQWPYRAYADDGAGYARSRNNGTGSTDFEHTDRHRYYNYDLSVPSGATILGIEARLDWWLDSRDGANRMSVDMSWDGGTSWTSTQTDSWERTSQQTSYLGGTSDTWGRTWSADDFTNGNFRLRVSAYSSDTDRDIFLDWIPVQVTYGTSTSPTADSADYDAFELCALGGAGSVGPTKPPLLRECGSVLSNATFNGGVFAPWVDGTESAAVVADGTLSCDLDGRANYGFSMLQRCDRIPFAPLYQPLHPWTYQEFTVPAFISTTEPVDLEMSLSLYYLVPAASGTEPFGGTLGRAEDKLQASVTVSDVVNTALTSATEIAHGAPPAGDRDRWLGWTGDLAPSFTGSDTLLNHVGETLRLRIDAPNVDGNGDGDEDGDSQFYIDQVECEICTTILPPDIVTGTVRRLGGTVTVLVKGIAQPMPGTDVWAMQLPDGPPPPQPDFQTTYAIQDSTYNFYNLTPGTYRIYAQVWVSGVLYTASETVTVNDTWRGQERTDVDLVLQ